MGVMVWVFAPFAVARLCQLVLSDKITERFREWVRRRIVVRFSKGKPAGLLDLFGCFWCLSVWFGLMVAACAVLVSRSEWWGLPVVTFALSELAIIIDRVMDRVVPDEMSSGEWAKVYKARVRDEGGA